MKIDTTPEVVTSNQYGDLKVILHERFKGNWQSRLACSFLERWGLVSAKQSGEDSAGRAKVGFLGVAETVSRACDMAEKAVEEFEARGWITEVKPYDELKDEADENRKKSKSSN